MNSLEMTKPNQKLTWIALLSGLQLIILWLNFTIPQLGYWITYVLPFMTLMVYLTTDKRGLLIYSITSVLLVLLFIQPFVETTLFYLLPTWLLGIGYGIGIKKKLTMISLLMILSIIQFFILYFIQLFSRQLYQLDLLALVYSLLNLDRNTLVVILDPILIYTIALLQVLIGLLFILPLIERFHIPIQYQFYFSNIQLIFFSTFFIFTIFALIWSPSYAFFGLGPLVLFTVFSYVYLLMNPSRYRVYILMIALVVYPFVNAFLSSVFEGPYRIFSILFLSFFPLLNLLFNSLTQKR